jgi:hypothetical protein
MGLSSAGSLIAAPAGLQQLAEQKLRTLPKRRKEVMQAAANLRQWVHRKWMK